MADPIKYTEEELEELNRALHELMWYSEDTGDFIRLVTRSWNAKKGMIAGTTNKIDGYVYIYITINGKLRVYKASRLAYLYIEGWLPVEVEHRNRIRNDNSWDNLRPATRGENSRNSSKQANTTSQYIGIYHNKSVGKWEARITYEEKTHYLSRFDTEYEAARVRDRKAIELDAEFFTLNFPLEEYK